MHRLDLYPQDASTPLLKLLQELQSSSAPVPRKLNVEQAKQEPIQKLHLNEGQFRFMFNEIPMAVDKLAEGIRNFAKDFLKLEEYVRSVFPEAF